MRLTTLLSEHPADKENAMREGFVTLGQAASRLGISDFALRDRLARGELDRKSVV